MKSSKKGNEKGIVNDHYDDVEDVESDDNLAENKDLKDKLKDNKYLEDDIPAQKAFAKVPLPKFDTSVFSKLENNNEYKYLFTYMNRYQPVEIDLDTKLKPFIPNYIPAIGEVDSFIKVGRPDKVPEELGLSSIDEPAIDGQDADIFKLRLKYIKKTSENENVTVSTVQNAEKNPRQIQSWIDKIAELHKEKMSSSVPYSKNMPDIEALMQIWPEKMENGLNEVKIPNENIKMSTENYAKIVCNMLDIPIHKVNSNKAIIEALHVLFSLYSVVKENIGYKNISKSENVIKFN